MRKMKMMLVVAMLLFSTQIFAQNRNVDPEQMAKRQTERMTERLSLTEDQAARVMEINKKAAEKMQAARESGELTADNRREFRQKQREERDAALKKALTEEQWTKWESTKKEQQNRGGRQGNGQRRQNQSGS